MNEIDWSKAPEGATHYNHTCFDWYKVGSHEPFFWNGRAWAPARFWDDRKHDCTPRQTTPSWSGEGLPPVGVVCEAATPHTSGPNNERSFIWIEGSVIAYYEIKGKTYAWFSEDEGFYPPAVLEFRPIRTTEQSAADERVAAVDEMVKACPHPDSTSTCVDCAALYDADYRKP